MSGPYGPQNTQELLERLVEEKGAMYASDVAKWVDYVDAYIEEQKQAHADMVMGQDEPVAYLSSNPSESIEPMIRNELRGKMRLRNQNRR